MEVLACPACDLLQRTPALPPGARARCSRCGETLATQPSDPLERLLALTLAAAIVFIVANATPLMGLSAVGRDASTTIIGGAYQMWMHGHEITAVVVAFCVVIAPAGYIAFTFSVLLGVRWSPAAFWVTGFLRWAAFMRPWSMSEVMMLGILVALVKIAQLATVIPGIGMYAVGALIVLLAEITATFEPSEVWKRIEWPGDRRPPSAFDPTSSLGQAR